MKGLNLTEEQQQLATLKTEMRAEQPNKAQKQAKREEQKQCRERTVVIIKSLFELPVKNSFFS